MHEKTIITINSTITFGAAKNKIQLPLTSNKFQFFENIAAQYEEAQYSTQKFKKYLSTYAVRAFVLTAQDQRTYIFTSQDFSWLQKGQLNCLSRGSALLLGAGFLLDLLLPILNTCEASQAATNFSSCDVKPTL